MCERQGGECGGLWAYIMGLEQVIQDFVVNERSESDHLPLAVSIRGGKTLSDKETQQWEDARGGEREQLGSGEERVAKC